MVPAISTIPVEPLQEVCAVTKESAYEVLGKTLKFTEDRRFWWDTIGYALSGTLSHAQYSLNSQFLHLCFFYMSVSPYLGPQPGEGNQPLLKSYMTDDHTPVEISLVSGPDGQLIVRYAIEPILSGPSSGEEEHAIAQMIDSLHHALDSNFDLNWFDALKATLSWPDRKANVKTKHNSQHFVGFDCLRSGHTVVKVYFLPEVRSAHTGIFKEDIVTAALSSLDAGFEKTWGDILQYFDILPSLVKPQIEIVATDCLAPGANRIKVYVRTRSTRFVDLEGLMTLGGSVDSPAIQHGMEVLARLWHDVMGIDTADPDWKTRSLLPLTQRREEHITSGILIYYELRSGASMPFPKVYLPVRHYCPDDHAIAARIEKHYAKQGNAWIPEYTSKVQTIFGQHRSLSTRTGIHTYVSLAIKKSGFDIARYYNPEIYAPERG